MNRLAMQLFVGAAGLVLCEVLSGCAVLTVDVDVYKGALVNEEHVQLHQLVALTTAAKPMLIQLRDKLEWPDTDGMPIEEEQEPGGRRCEKGDHATNWYQAGYVQSPQSVTYVPEAPSESIFRKVWHGIQAVFVGPRPSCQPHFQNPYARSVNIILSLYEDLDHPDLAPHGKALREALTRVRRATAMFEPEQQRDQKIFDVIAEGLRPEKELSRDLLSLLQAYKDLLVPVKGLQGKSRREVGQLMDAFQHIVRAELKNEGTQGETATPKPGDGIEAALLAAWQGTKVYDPDPSQAGSTPYGDHDRVYDHRLPFRLVWKLLAEGEKNARLVMVTRQLCRTGIRGDEACAQLRKRAKELADAYANSRQAARNMWEESLGLLVRIERLERAQPNRYRALKEKVVRLALTMTSVRQVASAVSRVGQDGICPALNNLLLREGKRICWTESTGPAGTEINAKPNLERLKRILMEALSGAPADTAIYLLGLDRAEQHADPRNSVATPLVETVRRVNPTLVVRLGLNRNFLEVQASDGESHAEDVFQVLEEVNRDLANGFGRGRLSDGLQTLTERYLQLHDVVQNGTDVDEQNRLLDSLVEFAQKLLFLANHDGLASPPGTGGLVLGGGKNILRGLFGDDAIGGYQKNSLIGKSRAPQALTDRYVRVLQAVGNTILFSANELREQERYRDLSRKRASAEVNAMKTVYSPDPQEILNDLVDELRHEQDRAQKQRDEATAQKAAIDGQRTDVERREQTSAREQATAEQDRQKYVTAQGPLKALHDVLTQEVIGKIKARWKRSGNETAADLAEFLSGADGMAQELTDIHQALNGIPAADERRLFNEGITYVKSPEAKSAFDAYRAINGHTSLKRAELVDALAAHLQELEAARAARVTQDDKTQKETAQKLVDLQNKKALLTTESDRLATVIAAFPAGKARLAAAVTVIESLKAEVLKDVMQQGQLVSPDAMYRLLATHVKRKEAAEPDVSKRLPYQDTLAVLSRRMPPPGLPPRNPHDDQSPLVVMDDMIALLRHRQMKAVALFGKGSDEEKKATGALENAYQHRAGMIYIRPSSAYLRTSFPSTSLQDDPNLVWDNMLLKQGIRNLPFSSQIRDILDPSVERDRSLTADLDKQYWQNINRVRVSGAGFTNQALVKDDVGNWYVKQYYGDTKDIVKSAKHLALYSLGTKLPIDLSRELRKASVTKEESKKTDAEKEAELPPLQQVFGKHRAAYQAHTTDTATRLVALHGRDNEKTLYAEIIAVWKGDAGSSTDADLMKALTVGLEEEVAQWDTNLGPLREASDQDRGLAIRKDLRALAKLEKQLSARIHKLDKQEALKVKAAKEVHRVVGRILIDLLEGHKQALDRYEQAVLFIGDAANPKDPKQEQGK